MYRYSETVKKPKRNTRVTKIEWADESWNPWHGCCRVAPECNSCYAITFDGRELHPWLIGVVANGDWTGVIKPNQPATWAQPFKWKRGRKIFTCSMSDFWHENVPLEMLDAALDVMDRTPQHTYQILTKRPGMIARRLGNLKRSLPVNTWLGLTVGHIDSVPGLKPFLRIDHPLRFLSCEPLLTSLADMPLDGISWVITGGESGLVKRCRFTEADWVRDLRDRCGERGIAYFHKQWGNWKSNPTPRHLELDPPRIEDGKKVGAKGGATLDGRLWREFP